MSLVLTLIRPNLASLTGSSRMVPHSPVVAVLVAVSAGLIVVVLGAHLRDVPSTIILRNSATDEEAILVRLLCR